MSENTDAVERAARALALVDDPDRDPDKMIGPAQMPVWTYYEHRARTALAAARAGEAVDREVLIGQALAETIPDGAVDDDTFDRVKAAVMDALAARGDAAPTEVQWGVRDATGYVRTMDEASARLWVKHGSPEGHTVTLVQRTVSAWRVVRS